MRRCGGTAAQSLAPAPWCRDVLVVAGTATQLDDLGDVVKLLITVVLQLVSAPLAAHTVGRAAYWAGTELSPENAIDQLAENDLEG